MSKYIPKRGDIIWMSFDPTLGHEQRGQRPAVVLSNTKYNKVTGLAIVCPITNKTKGFVGEIPLPVGMNTKGVILSNHVRGVDWTRRNVRFSSECVSGELIGLVLERIGLICSV